MTFCQIKRNLLLFVVAFLTLLQSSTFAQTCPASWNEWQWPTHTNWFVGKGNKIDFGDGTASPSASNINPAAWAPVYESTAAASDNDGNLVIFTNGVKLFDGTGAEITVPGGRLLTGSESVTGDAGSAVQGVFIARHPLDNENYYIFTTDDAILGLNGTTRGFNYFIYNVVSNSVSGPTRLQTAAGADFRCTEQIAATFHSNGIDVWISTHESTNGGSKKYLSYLLTCNGIEAVPIESVGKFEVLRNTSNERASLQFSWDGTKAGATYHNGNGTWDPDGSVTLLDFDNSNGEFSDPQPVSPDNGNHSNPYDCEFSPSGNRLYVSYQCGTGSEIGYINVGTGAYTGALNFDSDEGGALRLGGDGKIYTGTFKDCNGWGYGNSVGAISNPDGTPSYNGDEIITPNTVGWGLGNMFIPPMDWVEIQDPGALTECDLPVNLETLWLCKGTDAENTTNYENAYSVATTGPNACAGCTINTVTGVFNAPSDGTYEVHFEICDLKDTVIFTVGTCGCEAEVSNTQPICVGENFLLDTAVVKSSGVGLWTIDSVPNTPGVEAILNDSGSDTIFDATALNTKYGIYKLMFTVDNSCEDSMYIEVKKIPTVVLNEEGPLCDDSIAIDLTAIPVIDGINVNGAWQINNGLPTLLLPGDLMNFDPVSLGVGTHEIAYGVDSLGCQNADTIQILVKERPDPKIDQVGPYCANDPAVTLTMTPTSGDTGIWSGAADALAKFTPSNVGAGDHDVFYKIEGQCGATNTVQIHVDAVKDASIATHDSTVCADEAAIVLTTGDLTGTWFVNDTMPGSELGGALFDPIIYGAGTYELIYHLPAPCGDLDTVLITVVPIKDATINSADIIVCADEPQITLTTNNIGGVWFKSDTTSGSELGGPAIIASNHLGTFELYYYMSGMCGDIDTLDVTINELKDATINIPSDSMSYCVLDPNPTFTVNEIGGVWNNLGVIGQIVTDIELDLTALGLVTNEMLRYTQADPCGNADTIWVSTTNQLDATITPVGPYCDTDPSVVLTIVDAGGTFSGIGVDSNTGEFDPVVAGDGTHTITYTIPGNCGDVQTIDIIVNRTPDPSITNTIFEFCEDHGDEALTVTETGGTWREINSSNGGLDVVGGSFNTTTSADGTYNMEYGFPGACPIYDTLTFNITAVPVISFLPQDTLCEDDSPILVSEIVLPGSSLLSWSGDVDATGGFNPANKLGDNLIILTADNGGCVSKDTMGVHVLPREDATILAVDPVCIVTPPMRIFTAVGGLAGTWSGTGITDTKIGIFDPATAGPGIHEITHTIPGRCGDWDTILILVQSVPIPIINNVPNVCEGSTPFQLTSSVTGGSWTGLNITPDGIFSPLDSGSYNIVYVVTQPCVAAAEIKIEVEPIPDTDFNIAPRTGCVPFEVTFTDNSEEIPTQSSWDFGNSETSNDLTVATNLFSSVGCYDITLINTYSNGCESEKTITGGVCSYGNPIANFTWGPTVLDVENNLVVFDNQSSNDVVSYEWDFSNINQPAQSIPETVAIPLISNDENPNVIFDSQNGDIINVSLKVTNANGCIDSITKPLTILDKFSVYLPNAFTPNDDGLNDKFFPVGRNLEFGDNYEFRVYNRWGTLIWMSKTPYQGWDGRITEMAPSSGDIAQIDVYVWRLVVTDPFTLEDHELVGTVNLLK